VPGEHEILGQVKTAWDIARTEGTSGRGLNHLFRHALEVGKRARTETTIGHHVTSVSQAAVQIADDRLGGLKGRTAVVVGAGAMGRGMADFLQKLEVGELVIANRRPERAAEIVAGLTVPARAVPLAEVGAELATADLVLGATGAPEVILSEQVIREAVAGRDTSLLAIDVALPRDVDPAAATLSNFELLDMAAVAEITEAGLVERKREAVHVRRIVAEELERFAADVSARGVDPWIAAFRTRSDAIRMGELARFSSKLDGLDEADRKMVENLTSAIMAKFLHEPTMKLKESAGSSQGERLAKSLAELFDL
jgi:glutamyl-tRNA reductase